MITIDIPEDPTPWSAPRLSPYGAYDIKAGKKSLTRAFIQSDYQDDLIPGYVAVSIDLFYPVPKRATKGTRADMIEGKIFPTKSDCTNCQKYYEDCLKGIVFEDDRNVIAIVTHKWYAIEGHVLIKIWPYEEYMEDIYWPSKEPEIL